MRQFSGYDIIFMYSLNGKLIQSVQLCFFMYLIERDIFLALDLIKNNM